jgi:hypothetical protein
MVLERLEYTWWNFQIRMLDESELLQEFLPRLRTVWEIKDEAGAYLAWSLLGFPLGIVLGLLSVIVK